jgi:hypothetical protein
MDSTQSNSVLAALETLENAEDEEILRYSERSLNVGSRLLSVAKPTSADNRPRRAVDLIEIIIREQPDLHTFLSDDPSSAIRTIRNYDNLQLTSFAGDDQILFSHILDLRNWIWDYRSRYLPEILSKSLQDIPLKIPPQQGKLKRFIQSRGDLPDNVYTRLRLGQKCWHIEAMVHQKIENMIPVNANNKFAGIWILILPIFLKIGHVIDSVMDELVDILCSSQDLLAQSYSWSKLMLQGQYLRQRSRDSMRAQNEQF